MRVAAFALALSLFSATAVADDVAFYKKPSGRRECGIEWEPGNTRRLNIYLKATQGWTSLDRWLQVAPGGKGVATWSESSGLYLFHSTGTQLWHREGVVTAFRFSPNGDRLAVASRGGIEIVSVAKPTPRTLSPIAGAEWLRWVDGGLLARARGHLTLIDDSGKQRNIATLPKGAVVAASLRRVVYFAHRELVEVAVGNGTATTTKLSERGLVINAELSPDGRRILFGTADRVYLIDGASPPRKLADVQYLRTLFFSPDGSSYLWAAAGAGAVVANGKHIPLPSDATAARFRQDGGSELVLTTDDRGVTVWNPTTGTRGPTRGISREDGFNFGGDLAGSAVAAFYCRWSIGYKEHVAVPGGPVLQSDQ